MDSLPGGAWLDGPGLLAAIAIAGMVAGWGYLVQALTGRGALTATLVGAGILAWSGWAGGAALAAFFGLSSLLPRVLPRPATSHHDAKGERRDPRQVLANGGAAFLGALAFRSQPMLATWVVTTSLAAAAADTWATVIGTTSQQLPRRLLAGPPVPAGTNGGMTWRGCAGAVAGAASVAATGAFVAREPPLFAWAVLAGTLGMFIDSVLGATLQGRHQCDPCDTASEWRVHRCGRRTRHIGGLSWLDNDGVNLAAGTAAAILGAAGWHLARGGA